MHTKTAYVIDSLKHPSEIERLRSIYGPSFVAIGIYEPPELREKKLLKASDAKGKLDFVRELMERDEDEQREEFGQRLRKAFELSDIVVDASRKTDVRIQIGRLIRLLFGYHFLTPTQAEYGMFLARAAQVRSSAMSRQVGAAVLRNDGSVVSLGTNEAARPFGGQYWEHDDDAYERGRDFNRERDSSDFFRQYAIQDLLMRLKQERYLNPTLNDKEPGELLDLLFLGEEQETNEVSGQAKAAKKPKSRFKRVLKGSFVSGTIDYIRLVHAEMSAITDAGRNGIALDDHIMYTTTFPCHDCAKHIVSSGLKEVIYFEAYPKSLVAELYDDSIEINKQRPAKDLRVHFHSFVGIAPSRYLDFFTMSRERKNTRGVPEQITPATAVLRLPHYAPPTKAINVAETEAVGDFLKRAPRDLEAPTSTTASKRKQNSESSTVRTAARRKTVRKAHRKVRKKK